MTGPQYMGLFEKPEDGPSLGETVMVGLALIALGVLLAKAPAAENTPVVVGPSRPYRAALLCRHRHSEAALVSRRLSAHRSPSRP